MIRFAIMEDNPFAMEHLCQSVKRLRRDYELVFKASSVKEAVDFLKSSPDVDLLFMDIELSDGKCFAIFDQVQTVIPIIFTTAYDEFAIQAFKVNGIDYLLKPVSDQDLAYAIYKFEHLRSIRNPQPPYTPAPEELPVAAVNTGRILTLSGEIYSYIDIYDIAYFISEDNYVFACLNSGDRRLVNLTSLSYLEPMLPSDRFFRLSRSIIASIKSIESVSKYFRGRLLVKLKSGNLQREVIVSASNRDAFLEWFGR